MGVYNIAKEGNVPTTISMRKVGVFTADVTPPANAVHYDAFNYSYTINGEPVVITIECNQTAYEQGVFSKVERF
jgi:hypothetical protein